MGKSVFSLFCGAHDCNLSICIDGKSVLTIEGERLFGNRYFSLQHLLDPEQYTNFFTYIKNILEEEGFSRQSYDVGLFDWACEKHLIEFVTNFFKIKEVYHEDDLTSHHKGHAAGAFYSSGFDQALVFSYDGYGNDGTFCVYEIDKDNPNLDQINKYENNPIPTKYALFGYFISEIKKNLDFNPHEHYDILASAGKIMGLSSYGSPNKALLKKVFHYFENYPAEPTPAFSLFEDFPFEKDYFKDKESYDLAFCVQAAFEECFLNRFRKYFNEEKHKNVCLTGGGALNVVFNEKLSKMYPDTNFFVPCSPGDSGISYGMIAGYLKKQVVPELMYSGCPILDKPSLVHVLDHRPWRKVTPELIAGELKKGKIIGICRGDSETGPRALGNRSILADPRSHKAKDIINSKVKFREWFRPFAPICKEEKASIYFDVSENVSYKYMSFSPPVREEYRKQLPAITHVDGSSRLQTVSVDQNKFIYEVLDSFEELTGIPVLINTSFNTKGRAILTRYLEAIKVLDSTGLDAVVLDDYYIYKQ